MRCRCAETPGRRWRRTALLALAAGALAACAHAGGTLDRMRARGELACGVSQGLPGFSAPDAAGRWQGLDADICRAVAAAALGDANKVRFVPLSPRNRFAALQAGEIDLLSRNTTITLERDASLGLQMTAVTFYDAQGFLVPVASRVRAVRQLRGKTVCVQQNSTTIRNITEYSRAHRLDLELLVFDRIEDNQAAYLAGRCDAHTNDMSLLAMMRAQLQQPQAHVVLHEAVAKEPHGPMVRRGDPDWTAIVRWVVYGLIEAEELGITQANLEQLRAHSQDPAIQRIVGSGEDIGRLLGLDREWLARAVRATGNYGEIFERHLGSRTSIALPRGLNQLWNRGGLHYALPLR